MKSSLDEGTPAATIQEPDLGRVFDVAAYGKLQYALIIISYPNLINWNHKCMRLIFRKFRLRNKWTNISNYSSSRFYYRSNERTNHWSLGWFWKSSYDCNLPEWISYVCRRNWTKSINKIHSTRKPFPKLDTNIIRKYIYIHKHKHSQSFTKWNHKHSRRTRHLNKTKLK